MDQYETINTMQSWLADTFINQWQQIVINNPLQRPKEGCRISVFPIALTQNHLTPTTNKWKKKLNKTNNQYYQEAWKEESNSCPFSRGLTRVTWRRKQTMWYVITDRGKRWSIVYIEKWLFIGNHPLCVYWWNQDRETTLNVSFSHRKVVRLFIGIVSITV